jgi:rhodanese-related sulfurtransferase
MQSKPSILFRLAAWSAAAWAATLAAAGMTVSELQTQLAGGGKIIVVDVRGTGVFAEAHIPGAINIPAEVCPRKNLPPLGRVVIYGDGLGRDAASLVDQAAAALGKKPGITAEILEGGFAAWESAHAVTTRRQGRRPEALNYITYAQLKAAKAGDVVLVDLRKPTAAARQSLAAGANSPSQPLTDLGREFPGLSLAKSVPEKSVSGKSGAGPLVVLIDSADGAAEAAARALKGSGAKRYAILAGGELILARHGQAGSQRTRPGVVASGQNPAPVRGATNQ